MNEIPQRSDLNQQVYDELHRLACSKMSREFLYSTLQSTALVHEAWLKLGADEQPRWESKNHFFGAASEAMRRVLVDRARKRKTRRHGGELTRVNVENLDQLGASWDADDRLLIVNDVLDQLAVDHPRKAELVKLRFFFGMPLEEIAKVLGISVSTAQRWWAFSKAWLFVKLEEGE